jgi:hypothetical protein
MRTRSARKRTCAALSSPQTYTISPCRVSCDAICRSSVDLPAPGGPPTSVKLPGTIPPPSTASNSRKPEVSRTSCSPSTSRSAIGPSTAVRRLWARAPRAGAAVNGRCSKLFHASHCGPRRFETASRTEVNRPRFSHDKRLRHGARCTVLAEAPKDSRGDRPRARRDRRPSSPPPLGELGAPAARCGAGQ